MKMQNLVPWQDVSANISDPSNSIATAGSLFESAMGEFNNMIDRKKTSETDRINNDIMASDDPEMIRELLQGAKENNWADLNSINQTGVGRLDTLFSQNMETDKFDFTKDSEYWNRGFKEKELGQQMAIARMKEQGANARAMYKADQSLKATASNKKGTYLFNGTVEDFYKKIRPDVSISLQRNLSHLTTNLGENMELFDGLTKLRNDPITGKLSVDPKTLDEAKSGVISTIFTQANAMDPNGMIAGIAKYDDKGHFAGIADFDDPYAQQFAAGVFASVEQEAGKLINQRSTQNIEVATAVKNFDMNFAEIMGDANNPQFNKLGRDFRELIGLARFAGNPMEERDWYVALKEFEDATRRTGDPVAALNMVAQSFSDIPNSYKDTQRKFNSTISYMGEMTMKNKDNSNKYDDLSLSQRKKLMGTFEKSWKIDEEARTNSKNATHIADIDLSKTHTIAPAPNVAVEDLRKEEENKKNVANFVKGQAARYGKGNAYGMSY